jgi:hypothetical protein
MISICQCKKSINRNYLLGCQTLQNVPALVMETERVSVHIVDMLNIIKDHLHLDHHLNHPGGMQTLNLECDLDQHWHNAYHVVSWSVDDHRLVCTCKSVWNCGVDVET